MALDIFREKGAPLAQQVFDWRGIAQPPHSKLDDDAFTRVRGLFARAIEGSAVRLGHAGARTSRELSPILSEVRRVESHQQCAVTLLGPPDEDALETMLGLDQLAIEATANIVQNEPDPYLASVYDFTLVECVDRLYRHAALYDRLEGRDANTILQSYTDIVPGRPVSVAHRHPLDDLRRPYDRTCASPLSKIHAVTLLAISSEIRDTAIAALTSTPDPLARQLHAELASLAEQHVTTYASILDPDETFLERWLIHEATEVWAYWSCAATETNTTARKTYERFLDFELGHLHVVMELLRSAEGRDATQILPATLPTPLAFESQRSHVRSALTRCTELRADGTELVPPEREARRSIERRDALNAPGSPSEMVAAGYRYTTGGELSALPPATVAELAPAAAIERVLEEPPPSRPVPLRSGRVRKTGDGNGGRDVHAHARPVGLTRTARGGRR
jgi:hypothetical protein